MKPMPLPTRDRIKSMALGRDRAGAIRWLYAFERCSVAEIAAWLSVPAGEVRRTLLRPVRVKK